MTRELKCDSTEATRTSLPLWLRALAFLLFTFTFSFSAFADVPVRINFVGRFDAVPNGETVASPTSEKTMFVVFRLYDAPGSGRDADKDAALWGRQATVSLDDGAFDVDLSDSLGSKIAGAKYDSLADAIDASLARGSSALYIGLTPENDTQAEIFPRMRVTAVPKAVQAASVRTVTEDFAVGKGLFSANDLVAEGKATLASATYGTVAFTNNGQISFAGGLKAGTVTAKDVRVSGTIHANTLEVTSLSPTVPVTVSHAVTVNGSAVFNGAIGASTGPTVAVSVVEGPVSGTVGEAERLVVGEFENNSEWGFDAVEGVDWNVLGRWETVGATNCQGASTEYPIMCWDESKRNFYTRKSVTIGLWTADSDCIAYFQTHICNRSTQYGACVQFYILESTSDKNFLGRMPQAVASLWNGKSDGSATLDTVVPLILKKGQSVRWIGTNENQNPTASTILETQDSCVQTITYRKFNW